MTEVKEYTKEQYEADMRKKLKSKGLFKAVWDTLDDVIEVCGKLGCADFLFATEKCNDVLHLIELAESRECNLSQLSERKKGKWLYNAVAGWYCSECRAQAPFIWMSDKQKKSKYCPNCGVEMKKGKNE